MSTTPRAFGDVFGRTAALLALGSLAGACAASEPPPGPEGSDPGLIERLASPTPFDVDLEGSTATVVAWAEEAVEPTEFDLEIVAGTVVARVTAEQQLLLESFTVELDDVTIPADLVPPDGLPLRDIRVTIERPSGAVLDDLGDMVATVVELDVLVEWSGEFENGRTYPLRTMRLEDLPVAIEIERAEEGRLRAHVSAVRQGSFWQWGGLFELRDLVVDLDLVSP